LKGRDWTVGIMKRECGRLRKKTPMEEEAGEGGETGTSSVTVLFPKRKKRAGKKGHGLNREGSTKTGEKKDQRKRNWTAPKQTRNLRDTILFYLYEFKMNEGESIMGG